MRFMAIADIEIAIIDAKTNVREFQQQLGAPTRSITP